MKKRLLVLLAFLILTGTAFGALVHKRLTEIRYINSTATTLYANPGATTTYVKSIILFNGNTSAETVSIYYVPDSAGSVGTAGVSNIFEKLSVAANDTVQLEFPGSGLVMTDTNDSIQGVTTTDTKLTVQIYGATE